MSGNQSGKGSKPRPVNKDAYDRNYERIFGKRKKSQKNTGKRID